MTQKPNSLNATQPARTPDAGDAHLTAKQKAAIAQADAIYRRMACSPNSDRGAGAPQPIARPPGRTN